MERIKQALKWLIAGCKTVAPLIFIGLAFYAGFFVCQHFNKNVVEVPVEVEKRIEVPIEVPVEVKGETVIQYVEKQTPADADIEITQPAPVIALDYNGEKTELAGISGEKQTFDKGKLQVEQKTEAVLDVTPIVNREVALAVDKQKTEDKAECDKALQEEKHKAHRHGQKTFLYGMGAAGLLLLF